MQVRKSLQNPKSQRFKANKIQTVYLNLKEKKKNKILKTQRSKSRSKQNKQKENIKSKKVHNKSKQKVSPIKIKKITVLNTSPILYTQRKQKTPAKKDNENNKIIHSQRNQIHKHLISTKLNTQRTPVKKCNQQHIKTKSSTNKKNKKSLKQQYKNTKKTKIKIQEKGSEPSLQQLQKCFKKGKKVIPQINTIGPQRKQSYFDQQIIKKLNLDQANYLRRKKNQTYKQNLNQTQRYCLTQTPPIINHNSTSLSYRQYGTVTNQMGSYIPINIRDLQSFRKQQQLKWKIMYLQLSQLKHSRTPQKIQQILYDTHKNIEEFQYKSKQIVYSSIKNNYVFESPTKIKKALLRQRKSQQQNKSMVKTLSDQRLLQQLQILDNFDDKNKKEGEQKGSSSFCQQLQKQLQGYSQEGFGSNKNIPFSNVQLNHIPELEFQKSLQVYNFIESQIMYQFCADLTQNQQIFHSFLLKVKKIELPQQNQSLKVNCNFQYSVDLIHRLFIFINDNNLEKTIIDRINIPFGNGPLVNLKWLRNYFAQNQQQIYQDDQTIQPIIDPQILSQFEALGMKQPQQGQYFYHHCIYSSLNQIFDCMRPFGISGLPPLQKQVKKLHKNIQNIKHEALIKLKQILSVKMGRTQFNQQLLDPIKLAQKSYELMDKFLVQEQQQKWKKVEDNIFEQKYFLAQSIIDYIFNQEIMIIYNEF